MTVASHLIILNGTTSAGKTSISKEMQKILPSVFLHFQMDAFWDMVPSHLEANSKNFPRIKPAMLASVDALLKHDHNIILDAVFMGENVNKLRDEFAAYKPFLVKVDALPEVTAERERKRGDRMIGQAASQAPTIHEGVMYDFAVDTTELTAAQSAEKIVAAYQAYRPI